MRFSKDNQPQNRGRKPTGHKPTMVVSLNADAKEYYQKHKGLAGKILEKEYKQINEKYGNN